MAIIKISDVKDIVPPLIKITIGKKSILINKKSSTVIHK